jgi:hypothetical protein
VATWQAKTDEKLRQNAAQQRLEALQAQRAAGLEERRQRLAALLQQEEEELKAELVASQLTPEQRRQQMAARARQLAAAREAERQQIAQELLDRAFRESCDPLRAQYSQQIVMRTKEEREQQVGAARGSWAGCGRAPPPPGPRAWPATASARRRARAGGRAVTLLLLPSPPPARRCTRSRRSGWLRTR